MNPLLDQAEEWLRSGQRSDRRGLYHLAYGRYSMALATLINVVTLRDAGVFRLSSEEERRLAMLYQILSARFQSLVTRTGNGHKMSGRQECKDTLGDAIRTLLHEMESFG